MKKAGIWFSLLFWMAAGTAAALQPEAGFVTIEPVFFYFHFGDPYSRMAFTSTEARIWYSYLPADRPEEGSPLFVFFNGGPGSATGTGLMTMGTGRFTLDTSPGSAPAFVANPVSWTRLGHLLYIDARQAGFSYNVLSGEVENVDVRFREFNAQNFNPFLDAADFIRVLLRFLAGHPELRDKPVFLVGESYGGLRATVMLHILLHPAGYGDGSEMYQDSELVAEIERHYQTVFPESGSGSPPPFDVARRFAGQILIQPVISLEYQTEETDSLLLQPGSPLQQAAEEAGIAYEPLQHGDTFDFIYYVLRRDPFNYPQPFDWTSGYILKAAHLLRRSADLSLVTGVDASVIPEFYASARSNAYRLYSEYYPQEPASLQASPVSRLFVSTQAAGPGIDGREPGDLESLFGELQSWDWFLIPSNPCVNLAFTTYNTARKRGYEVDFALPAFGRMFLSNTLFVPALITGAALDLVIYTPALAPALARHDDLIVEAALHPPAWGFPEDPTTLRLRYRAGAFPGFPGEETRTVWFPRFPRSGHMVSLSQPEELFEWVSIWLKRLVSGEGAR